MNTPVSGQERDPITCPKTGEDCIFVNFCESKKLALDENRRTTPKNTPEAVVEAFGDNFCAKEIGQNLVEAAFNPTVPYGEAATTVLAASKVNRGQDPFPAGQ